MDGKEHDLGLRRILKFLICLALIVHFSWGELRFCYNGPQRIKYEDCPGGFIAKKTVTASCVYFFKGVGEPDMMASFSKNVCDHTTYTKLEPPTEDFENNEFQFIRFYDVIMNRNVDGDNSTEATAASTEDARTEMCNETCLGDYGLPPTKILGSCTPPGGQLEPTREEAEIEEEQKKYVELTKLIMIKIVNEDEYVDADGEISKEKSFSEEVVDAENFNEFVDPSGNMKSMMSSNWSGKVDFLYEHTDLSQTPMSSLLKLLAKSMRVTYKKCKPYLEPSFYTLVFRSMQEFRRMAEFFPNMHVVPLNRILKLLDSCEKAENIHFELGGRTCDEKRVVKTITNPETNVTRKHTLTPRSFRWGLYDPIVEAAWASIQFVHGHCFPHFSNDILHFSLYVRSMNELFIQPLIERHWNNPTTVGKGLTLWEMVYDTSDILNQMRNLDACVSAGYEDSIFNKRLERPFTSEEALFEPKFEDVEDTSVPQPGWTKTVGEYWKMYENKGFQQMVDELGICITDPTQFSKKGRVFINNVCPEVL